MYRRRPGAAASRAATTAPRSTAPATQLVPGRRRDRRVLRHVPAAGQPAMHVGGRDDPYLLPDGSHGRAHLRSRRQQPPDDLRRRRSAGAGAATVSTVVTLDQRRADHRRAVDVVARHRVRCKPPASSRSSGAKRTTRRARRDRRRSGPSPTARPAPPVARTRSTWSRTRRRSPRTCRLRCSTSRPAAAARRYSRCRANSRFTVSGRGGVPGDAQDGNRTYGAVIESLSVSGQPPAQIVVERAMYSECERRLLGRGYEPARDAAAMTHYPALGVGGDQPGSVPRSDADARASRGEPCGEGRRRRARAGRFGPCRAPGWSAQRARKVMMPRTGS